MKPPVFLIEDEPAVRDALALLLHSRGLKSTPFDSAERFLAHVAQQPKNIHQPSCAVMDVRMQRVSGIEAFTRLNSSFPNHCLSVIFLTGHGDVAMAVNALKDGAFDFFEKPLNDNRLVDRIEDALKASERRFAQLERQREIAERMTRLSTREREVMDLIVEGKLNKVVASDLGISMRTVEVHRASVFEKMQVRSAVELANLLGRHTPAS